MSACPPPSPQKGNDKSATLQEEYRQVKSTRFKISCTPRTGHGWPLKIAFPLPNNSSPPIRHLEISPISFLFRFIFPFCAAKNVENFFFFVPFAASSSGQREASAKRRARNTSESYTDEELRGGEKSFF
ncbi:hypothetical protein CDAR_186341 [Caerostris darwini]|uniref:Uncharacterized protein n=1 Tax=Caerostris darwini TaxID=1538125 RepID=A0AAV4WCR5_9ARAC|nr:hypothetical protein CDAR_186341 [Caerostris darwini]